VPKWSWRFPIFGFDFSLFRNFVANLEFFHISLRFFANSDSAFRGKTIQFASSEGEFGVFKWKNQEKKRKNEKNGADHASLANRCTVTSHRPE
jgi:hypothetical protein